MQYKIFQKLLIGGTHIILGDFLLDQSRKYKGRFWDLWKETHDDGTIEIMLCHKKYTLALQTDEFASLWRQSTSQRMEYLERKHF